MDFFNKAKEKLTKTGNEVAQKAKELAEITKLSSQVSAQENIVKSAYSEIGKYVYENLREDAPAEMAEKMEAIDAALAEIARLKEEIRKLKGSCVCPQCGKEVDDNVAFCPACGTKMPEPVVEVVDEGEVTEVVEEAVTKAEEAVEDIVEKVEDAVEAVAEKVEDVINQ